MRRDANACNQKPLIPSVFIWLMTFFLKIAIFENHEIPLCFWDIPALTKIELFSTKCILPLIENYFGEWAQ